MMPNYDAMQDLMQFLIDDHATRYVGPDGESMVTLRAAGGWVWIWEDFTWKHSCEHATTKGYKYVSD